MSYTRLRIFGCKQRAVWCRVVQPNCSCTFPPLPTMATVLALTLAPFLHYFPISFHQNGPSQKLSSPTQQLSKKVGIIIIIILPNMVTGQQQKSPSMLHTAGTPQSHLSFGVNSNMTVTFYLGQNSFFTNQYVTGGKRTKRPRAVPAIRGQPRLRGNSTKRNLLFAPKPAHL